MDHPSARSELDLQGNKANIRKYIQTCVCNGGGSDSHRWGCLQSRWTHHCPAEYPQPGLNWVKTAAAGSGKSKKKKKDRWVNFKQELKVERSTKGADMVRWPVALPCTPSAVWEEHEDPGCFGVLRNSIYPCSVGTARSQISVDAMGWIKFGWM